MREKGAEILNEKLESYLEGGGRNPRKARCCERQTNTATQTTIQDTTSLIRVMFERENMLKAYERLARNKGAPGVDKMTTEDLKGFLKEH